MRYVLTQEQMKNVDKYSIETLGISGIFLMERAAKELVKIIEKKQNKNDRILIVVESGNNGGDGLAAARFLKEDGYDASVYHINAISSVTDSFKEQLKLAQDKGVAIYEDIPADEDFDVVVDGIFGIGLRRNIKDKHEKVIDWMNRMKAYKYAIDIPSGIHATTGKVMGVAFKADMTVTFGYLKMGQLLYPGTRYCGKVKVRDIGFPEESLRHVKPSCVTFGRGEKNLKAALKHYPKRKARSNKGDYGRILLVAGSEGMSGAALMAAKAAFRSGVGLVRILTHESNRSIIGTALPEAIVDTYSNLDEAYSKLDKIYPTVDAVLVGSGLGLNDISRGLTKAVIDYSTDKNKNVPVIVDGDALTIISQDASILGDYKLLPKENRARLIFTPHLKEMERISDVSVSEMKSNLIKTAENYVDKLELNDELTVVLKDARTVVTTGSGFSYINMTGNDGMSTAGSGDVLAGIITALEALGRKNPKEYMESGVKATTKLLPTFPNMCMKLACLGVDIHGAAGDMAADDYGKVSMMATDIIDELPYVFMAKEN